MKDEPAANPHGLRRVGRPPDPRIDKLVEAVAMGIIAESGWRGLTFDNVATRSGVARSTLYRRYGTVSGLMLALMDRIYNKSPVPDTGTLRGDLTALMDGVRRIWSSPVNRRYPAALVVALDEDDRIAAAYRKQLRERRLATSAILERAVERGEVHRKADPDVVLDLLAGFTVQHVLVRREPLTASLCAQVVDLVCAALTSGTE